MGRVTIVSDSVDRVLTSLKELTGKEVLVGIPESETERDDSAPITNAALGYIHEFGSPPANIPARPFLIPGVRAVEDKAVAELQKAADAALSRDTEKATQHMERAGLIGEIGAKDAISNGAFVPLQPGTIEERYRDRRTQTRRQDEEHYLALVKDGMSPEGAQNATGIRPLVNTGQLRNSLTHVVRRKRRM